jgi:ElaB/YqjD/DUF883 family membrane-anchored ribosome-binding protein
LFIRLHPSHPRLRLAADYTDSGRIYAGLYSFATSCAHKRHPFPHILSAQILLKTATSPNSISSSEKEYSDMPDNGSINEPTTATTGTSGTIGATGSTGTGAATGLSQTAHDYGQKISEVASQAKDYVTDKVSVVGDKFKELQNADLGELAENAKEYARQKPGQALLISAAAGLLLGLIIRGRR